MIFNKTRILYKTQKYKTIYWAGIQADGLSHKGEGGQVDRGGGCKQLENSQ